MANLCKMVVNDLTQHNIVKPEHVVQHFLIFLSDFIFKGPVLKFAQYLKQADDINVYMYLFDEKLTHFPDWIGCSHWNEMDFVFGIPLMYKQRFNEAQQNLSERLIRTWTHFAKTGYRQFV